MKINKILISCLIISAISFSCKRSEKKNPSENQQVCTNTVDTAIVDCNYSFEQAIFGTKAPKSIINQLELINVRYYSMDGKIHQGQILVNKAIKNNVKVIFEYILKQKFPIAQAIPIVKYNWNDNKSMEANNTYSFCYRDISYSKHALGMAIDINPFLNPNRWKKEYSYRKNKPVGAVYNSHIPGTFSAECKIVAKFKELGFFWGHNFKRNFDDHHFEKQ
jgi:hypothetical protein